MQLWSILQHLLLSYFAVSPPPPSGSAIPQSTSEPPPPPPSSSLYPIPTSSQAHSFNDLDQWESLYLKGVRNFKIDPYFFQEKLSVRPNKNHSYIALTHDYPLLRHDKYFSLGDVLREVAPGGRIGAHLASASSSSSKLVIQLCFKAVPALCGSSNKFRTRYERDFLALVDEFYVEAEHVRVQQWKARKLEFVLDGGGKPYGCLANKWPNWQSVWISNDAPYSPPGVLALPQNESTRFEILNNPADTKAWQQLAKMNFGWFARSSRPYQVWEPNDQQLIHDHIIIYQSSSSPQHNKGLCFSSNSDPVMIALYTGAHQAAANQQLLVSYNNNGTSPKTKKKKDPVAANADLQPIGIAASVKHLNMLFLSSKDGKVVSVLVPSKGSIGQQQAVQEGATVVSSYAWERYTPSVDIPFWGTLSDSSGRFAMVLTRVGAEDGQVVVLDDDVTRAPLPPQLESVSAASKCLVVRALRAGRFVAIWSVSALRTETEDEDDESDLAMRKKKKKHGCATYAVLFDERRVAIKSTCLSTDDEQAIVTGADLMRLRGTMFGVVFTNNKRQVFSTLWSSKGLIVTSSGVAAAEEEDDGRGDVDDTDSDAAMALDSLKQIGVGTNPRFSELPALLPGNRVVALVLGDSHCANNEPINKRANVLLCRASASAMRGTLTYSLGLARDWEHELFRRPKKHTLSACSSQIFHGAFDIGANAVPHLVLTSAGDADGSVVGEDEEDEAAEERLLSRSWGEAKFISVHHTVDDLRPGEQSCAVSRWKNSLVTNQFRFFFELDRRRNRQSLRLLQKD